MYRQYYGLREAPFSVSPDPRFLFMTRYSQEALASLTYGIQNRKGFILLTGEVGTGKTTLLNKLFDWLRGERAATAFVFNSRLNTTQFLDFVMADFGISCGSGMKSQLLMRLNQWLLERYAAGEPAVLVVDEAQNLSIQVLEEIRLLTNLETSTDKLLQIVLCGQPELEVKLRQPQLRQLRQRITLRCKTHPLSPEETHGYIAERLRIAGADSAPIFSPDAIESIFRFARGIPRVVNVICEHALISAYVDQQKPVEVGTIAEVARDLELDRAEQVAGAPADATENVRLMEALQTLATMMDRLRKTD
jgi:general secretion pathway protein A